MFKHFEDLVDPDHVLSDAERTKLAENARQEHLARITLQASRLKKSRRNVEEELQQVRRALAAVETDGDEDPPQDATALPGADVDTVVGDA